MERVKCSGTGFAKCGRHQSNVGGGSRWDGQLSVLPALKWLRSAQVKWSGSKHPVMLLGGLRRCSRGTKPSNNPLTLSPKAKQNPELLRRPDTEEKRKAWGSQRGGGNLTKPYSCISPQKYTEPSLCPRTNGWSGSSKNNGEGKYTWPLPTYTHTHMLKDTHSHIPLAHFTYMVNNKFTMLTGLQWGEFTQVTSSDCFIHLTVDRCLSAAGTTSGLHCSWYVMFKKLD